MILTKRNFNKKAPAYGVLHLSTHASSGDYVKASNLSFYDDTMFLNEFYSLDLNTNLVVLSACETAIGEFQRGEGIVSLARGFFYAGVESIVTTLWKLDDKSSLELMPAFYGNMKAGMTKDVALQKAKLNFLNNNQDFRAHPLYWASFVPVGNMEILEISPQKTNFWVWILLGLAIFSSSFIFKKVFFK